MKQSLIKILSVGIIIGVIIGFGIFLYNGDRTKMSKESFITITQDGIVEVTDIVTIPSQKAMPNYFDIPLAIQKDWQSGYPQNMNVVLDDKIIIPESFQVMKQKDVLSYHKWEDRIMIKNPESLKNGEHTLRITYSYNVSDIIEQYNNYTILKLKCRDAQEKYRITSWNNTIKFPDKIEGMQVDTPKVSIERLDDYTFKFDMSKQKVSNGITASKILFDTNKILGATRIYSDYDNSYITRFKKINELSRFKEICYIIIIEIPLLLVVLIMRKKPKVEKKYIRNPKEVIDPILAESIIDRKVNAKNLIMSCIVNLINKGNLKNIGNDKIKLISYQNTSEYEKDILKIIFTKEGEIVEYSEINKIFVRDDKKTNEIFSKLFEIKNKITTKLFEEGIYSKLAEKILKTIRVIGLFIYIGIIFFSMELNSTIDLKIMCMGVMLAVVMWYPKDRIAYRGQGIYLGLYLWIAVAIFICLMFRSIVIPVAVILNAITLRKSRIHIFTRKGKQEYEKVKGIKAYIEEYSLMESRDVESVILWDEYLAYATAFGISNKITEKFDESMLNLNMALQKLASFLL